MAFTKPSKTKLRRLLSSYRDANTQLRLLSLVRTDYDPNNLPKDKAVRPNSVEVEYEVLHNTGITTLTSNVMLEKRYFSNKWVASVNLTDFPECNSAEEAAEKLGEWLIRLGSALIENNVNNIDVNELERLY